MSAGESVFDASMNKPPAALPRWTKGDEITAERLNAPVDAHNRMTQGVGLPRQVTRRGIATGVKVQRFKITELHTNYLVCHTLDIRGVEGKIDIIVAKPYLLRTLADVNPPYATSGQILGIRNVAGGTGFTFDGEEVAWTDANVDGRSGALNETAFPVVMAKTSGDVGDQTTKCGYRYTVTHAISSKSLGTNVDPTSGNHKWQRPSVGAMIPATRGQAYWNSSANLVIFLINEQVEQGACP